MPTALLDDRAIIEVSGEEAEPFLQNIVTVDLDRLEGGECRPGALLSPQGKILFDFLVARHAGGFLIECRADIAEDFIRRLMLYRLRSKVMFAKREQGLVAVSWRNESSPSQGESRGIGDIRFHAGVVVTRDYAPSLPRADASAADWHVVRIANGVAESGLDYALGETFPHDVLLDQNGGVGFGKGCYVGQEVVSRMQHRGTARRRILIARAEAGLPPPGAGISAGGRALGAMGSVAGDIGLALVRIDRVKEAMDAGEAISAEGVRLSLAIPEWAKFGFPSDPPGADRA